MPTNTKEEIQVCGFCGATGIKIYERRSTNGEYTYTYEPCTSCEGSGLQTLITTITKTLKPYKPKVAKDGKLVG